MSRPCGLFAGGVLALLVLPNCTARTLAQPDIEAEPPAAAGDSNGTSASSSGTGGTGKASCNGVVLAYVRDFSESHPDMEPLGRSHEAYSGKVETGIVKQFLGADRKPVFN